MKYIKSITIFLISLQYSALYAQEPLSIEPIPSQDIQQMVSTEIPAEPVVTTEETNELQDWDDHLKTLSENWNTSTNTPEPTWTSKAIEIAVTAVTANNSLAEQLKSAFLDAINQQTTKFTAETITVVADFNNAIDKALVPTEEKEETPVEQPSAPEQVTTPEPPSEEKPAETTPTETAPTTEVKAEPEKTEPAKEEKKENPIEEWNNTLRNMQSSRGDIYDLINKAAELAQKIQEQNLMETTKLVTEFGKALEGTIVVRKLPPSYKRKVLDSFASLLGFYIPAPEMPIDYYEPYMPTQEMAPSPEEIEAMQQKLAEQERIAALEAERHREAMIKQAAINLAIEKEQLTQKQWQKAQESIREAEQRKIRELQAEAEQLKRDLKKATAEQKAAGEKTLFERAKERVTEFIWGPTQPTKTTEESITEKKKQLEQLTKQIEEEEEAFFKETCQKNEQAKRAEEIRTLTGYKLTAIETARKVQLEAEERECARIADTKNLAAQQHEWLAFMDYIRNNKAATKESNEWVTEQAIEKAISMLKVASRLPSVDIVHIEQTLKDTFPKALVDQQREKLEKLNIFINQSNFNTAINNFVK